jgi:hypothetical protein
MIRVLVMIAVTGFLVSVVTLSGPEVFTDSVWNRWVDMDGHWGWTFDDNGRHWGRGWNRDGGPDGTREIAWSGGDTLDVDIPAEITFTQAPGPGKLTITGPQREIDNVELDGGHLHFRHHGMHRGDVTIVMTAPDVTHFDVSGSGKLAIAAYNQDKLSVDLSGNADVSAKGQAKSLALSVSGSGNTDLSDLKVGDASVAIEGSGEATLAPTGAATIDISGSGDVTLLTRPSKLESNVSGSGSIHQKDGSASVPNEPPSQKAKPART